MSMIFMDSFHFVLFSLIATFYICYDYPFTPTSFLVFFYLIYTFKAKRFDKNDTFWIFSNLFSNIFKLSVKFKAIVIRI